MEGKHPIVLDPVGIGATSYRRKKIKELTGEVKFDLIRCNQEEALVLLSGSPKASGGVESALSLPEKDIRELATDLALKYDTVAYISGKIDAISDGKRFEIVDGGSPLIKRITGGGCMLSALCAMYLAAEPDCFLAALAAGTLWRLAAAKAEKVTNAGKGGIGTFYTGLFDAVDELSGSPGKGVYL